MLDKEIFFKTVSFLPLSAMATIISPYTISSSPPSDQQANGLLASSSESTIKYQKNDEEPPNSFIVDDNNNSNEATGRERLIVASSSSSSPDDEDDDVDDDETSCLLGDNSNVPHLSLPRLFWFFFYNFGLFAWGGPVAQIVLLKDRLVIQDKWITLERFQRVFSVYQILPGPEAVELCMFFGCLSAGRMGGIVAGVAFTLPGFVLMLLASYVYSLAGFDNKYFNASFRSLQPIVAAMVSFVTSSGLIDTPTTF